jgi:hypothetical protein
MFKKHSLYSLLLGCCLLKSQLPNTELWLLKVENTKEGMSFKKPLNITNRDGYDNQPSFSRDNKRIYYVSVRDDKQADIYYYDLKTEQTIQLTKTPLSEYSPVETPDGKFISAVVVEIDSAQRIHFIDKETGVHEDKFDFDSVGYYHFLNNDTCIYYKLTNPHSLRFRTEKQNKWLGFYPTRTFKTINRHTLIYGIKDSTKVTFYQYDFLLRKGIKYCEYSSLSEDIVWHPALGLIISAASKLYYYDKPKSDWLMLVDLATYGIKKITRFNFDSDNKYLVVVDNL